MSEIRDVLETLLAGGFICQYAYPELHRQLRAPGVEAEVRAALAPLGRELGTIGEETAPDTYFSRYADLSDAKDRAAAAVQLVQMRDQLKPCLEFIRLFNRSGRTDACLAPGDTVSFSDLLEAIENNPTYRDQLRDLSGHEFFSKSKSAKDNKERLALVLRPLADAGYLVKRSSESANYVATGKMGYFYMILAWVAEFSSLSLDPEPDPSSTQLEQRGLEL